MDTDEKQEERIGTTDFTYGTDGGEGNHSLKQEILQEGTETREVQPRIHTDGHRSAFARKLRRDKWGEASGRQEGQRGLTANPRLSALMGRIAEECRESAAEDFA